MSRAPSPPTNTIISDVIGRWPSRRGLANELGVKPHVVHKMHGRGHIPPKHHHAILASAKRLGIKVTLEELHGRPANGAVTDQYGQKK